MKILSNFLSKLSPRQFGFKQYLIFAIILVPLLVASAVFYLKQSEAPRPMGAELAHVEGRVEYQPAGSKAWQTARADMPLEQGASLRVTGTGRAVINLDDGSAIRLNSDSAVQLASLNYKHVLVENDGGQVYTRVTKSDSRVFEVKTSKSTYRSMGTAYRTIDTPDKEGVEVYHSKVNVLGNTRDGVIVEQGERYYQVDKNNPSQASKVAEIDRAAITADSFIAWNSEEDRKEFQAELGVLFDIKPPALEVSSPANGLTTASDKVDIKGTTEAGAKVLINGQSTANTDGTFNQTMWITVGPNAFKIESEDGAGNKTVKTFSITRTSPAAPPPAATPPSAATKAFKLYGTKVDNGISFSWTVSGYDVSKGFKLLLGTSTDPTYEGKTEKVYLESGARSYTWKIKDGQTYYYRICAYNGSSCSAYSNTIAVQAPAKPETPSPSGSVTISDGSSGNVSWILAGSAPNGYKLVWNTTGSPVYPGSSASYYNPGTTSGAITGDPGTYYVRLCMYKDGTCPIYSNEIQVTIP